jgi:hypothetical protein
MRYKSIDNKQIDETGEKLIFTEPSLLFTDSVKTIAVHEVTIHEVCRIDMISKLYYNDINFSELILKYNNISNPFSINEGDVLNIPDHKASMLSWQAINPKSINKTSIRDQFISTKRLTVKDANRSDYLQRKAAQRVNGSKQILPPNILKEDDKNIDINGDAIII